MSVSVGNNRLYDLPTVLRTCIYENLSYKDLKRSKDTQAVNCVLNKWYKDIQRMPQDSFLFRIAKPFNSRSYPNHIKMKRICEKAVSVLKDFQPFLSSQDNQEYPFDVKADLENLSFKEINQRADFIADKHAKVLIDYLTPHALAFEPIQELWASIEGLSCREKARELRKWLEQHIALSLENPVMDHIEISLPGPFEIYSILIRVFKNHAVEINSCIESIQYDFSRSESWEGPVFRFLLNSAIAHRDPECLATLFDVALRFGHVSAMKEILKTKWFSLKHLLDKHPDSLSRLEKFANELGPKYKHSIERFFEGLQKFQVLVGKLTKDDLKILCKAVWVREWGESRDEAKNKLFLIFERFLSEEEAKELKDLSKEKIAKIYNLIDSRIEKEFTLGELEIAELEAEITYWQQTREIFKDIRPPSPLFRQIRSAGLHFSRCSRLVTSALISLNNMGRNLAQRLCGR